MNWMKARKKPVEIEFREVEAKEQVATTMPDFKYDKMEDNLSYNTTPVMGETINTREGTLIAIVGQDFIIRGVEGELYPIKKDIFYKTYEVL